VKVIMFITFIKKLFKTITLKKQESPK